MATAASVRAGGVRLYNSNHFPRGRFFDITLANASNSVLGQVHEALVASSVVLKSGDLISADYLRVTVFDEDGFDTRKPLSTEAGVSLLNAINTRGGRTSGAFSVSTVLQDVTKSVASFVADRLQQR
jgi:hypothetical protein